MEKQANRFAAAFLGPADALIETLEHPHLSALGLCPERWRPRVDEGTHRRIPPPRVLDERHRTGVLDLEGTPVSDPALMGVMAG